jgi:hypothetical protein
MNLWIYIAIQIISYLIQGALAPKQKAPEPAKVQVPTAVDGKPIIVIFGDTWVDDANVLWFGDERTTAIKSKSKK